MPPISLFSLRTLHDRRRTSGGFSLVEMTVVLLILSVVLAGVLPLLAERTDSEATETTEQRMKVIEGALASFKEANKRLPCPTNNAAAINNEHFGVEAPQTGGTPSASPHCDLTFGGDLVESANNRAFTLSPDSAVAVGGVPTVTLGLSDEYMFDGWGRRFTYHVEARLTQTNAMDGKDETGNVEPDDPYLTIQKTSGAPIEDAIYSLMTHGPSGNGAYLRSGERYSAGTLSPDEAENLNDDATLVQRSLQLNATTAERYDDVNHFRTKDTVNLGTNNSGGVTPGGNINDIQYNTGAGLGGEDTLEWNATSDTLTVVGSTNTSGTANIGTLDVSGNGTVDGTLGTGPLTVTGIANVSAGVNVGDDLNVNGMANFEENVNIMGVATIGDGTDLVSDWLHVRVHSTFHYDTEIRGNTVLGDASGVDTVTVRDPATFQASSTFAGVGTFQGLLATQANVTLGDAIGDSVTIAGTLSVGSTSTFASHMTVNGNITAQSFLYSSDERLKDEIDPIKDEMLQAILALEPVRYHYKADAKKEKRIGFIAQSVQKQFPELVNTDKDGMLAIDYAGLTVPIVKAVQELAEQQKALEARVAALENASVVASAVQPEAVATPVASAKTDQEPMLPLSQVLLIVLGVSTLQTLLFLVISRRRK